MESNQKYLAALGGGYGERPKFVPRDPERYLTPASKLRVEATLRLAEQNQTNSIIVFSGGRTAKGWPSEAEAMWEYGYIRANQHSSETWQNLLDNAILEEESIDTRSNIVHLKKIGLLTEEKSTKVITSAYHKPRVMKMLIKEGIQPDVFSAEEIFRNFIHDVSEDIQSLMNFSFSTRLRTNITEYLLQSMLLFDPELKIASKVTAKVRG